MLLYIAVLRAIILCVGGREGTAHCVPVPFWPLEAKLFSHPLSYPKPCFMRWKSHSEHFSPFPSQGVRNRGFPSIFLYHLAKEGREEAKNSRTLSAPCLLPFSHYLNEEETELVIAPLPSSIPPQPSLGKRLRGKGNVVGVAELAWTMEQNFLLHRFLYGYDSPFGWSCFVFSYYRSTACPCLRYWEFYESFQDHLPSLMQTLD